MIGRRTLLWNRGAAALLALNWCLLAAEALPAGTLVLANRTTETVVLRLGGADRRIVPGDLLALRSSGSHTVRFAGGMQPYYTVDPNSIYFLAPVSSSRIDLVRIGLGGDGIASNLFESDRLLDGDAEPVSAPPKMTVVPVALMVDEEEPATRERWEQRLRERLKAASAIFERHAFVRFEVVSVSTWKSDDDKTEFERSFADFEQKVRPHKARLVIGFTSQYRLELGRTHLGGTRGPLHSHLLVREWSNRINEPERLEVLVHELGHFLGAVHSPEPDSVMRAVLGDRQARAAQFRIGFDPVNTLAMCLVSESMGERPLAGFAQLDLATQLELHKLYGEIARTKPHDPTAAQYVKILERSGIDALVRGTQLVLLSVTSAAQSNAQLPEQTSELGLSRLAGDALAELLVRRAADLARRRPEPMQARSFLLGIGLGLDRTAALKEHRLIGPLAERMENAAQRQARIAVLGVPTAHDKHELARHFAIAAALTAINGPHSAERACLALQLADSSRAGHFSTQLYQADLAGILFAHRVLQGTIPLSGIAADFSIAAHLPEGTATATLSAEEFRQQFGSLRDPRFQHLRTKLAREIRALR